MGYFQISNLRRLRRKINLQWGRKMAVTIAVEKELVLLLFEDIGQNFEPRRRCLRYRDQRKEFVAADVDWWFYSGESLRKNEKEQSLMLFENQV